MLLMKFLSAHFPSIASARWVCNNRHVEMVYDHNEEQAALLDFILRNKTMFDAEPQYCTKCSHGMTL